MDMFFYLKILKKRLYIFISGVMIVMIASCYYNYFVLQNVYESYATIYVGAIKNNNDLSVVSSLSAANVMIVDYREIITSRLVYDSIVDELRVYDNKKNLSYEDFTGKVFVGLLPNTRILRISVEDKDPVFAKVLAEKITQNFARQANSLTKIDNLSIVDNPVVPEIPVKPARRKNIVFSMVVVVAVMTGVSILIELLDKKVRNKENLETISKVKVLGTIPRIIEDKDIKKRKRGVVSVAKG